MPYEHKAYCFNSNNDLVAESDVCPTRILATISLIDKLEKTDAATLATVNVWVYSELTPVDFCKRGFTPLAEMRQKLQKLQALDALLPDYEIKPYA